jgi:hypothetical protein
VSAGGAAGWYVGSAPPFVLRPFVPWQLVQLLELWLTVPLMCVPSATPVMAVLL